MWWGTRCTRLRTLLTLSHSNPIVIRSLFSHAWTCVFIDSARLPIVTCAKITVVLAHLHVFCSSTWVKGCQKSCRKNHWARTDGTMMKFVRGVSHMLLRNSQGLEIILTVLLNMDCYWIRVIFDFCWPWIGFLWSIQKLWWERREEASGLPAIEYVVKKSSDRHPVHVMIIREMIFDSGQNSLLLLCYCVVAKAMRKVV